MNLVGKTIGDYQIESEIGRGGTSTVYRAVDSRDGKTLALKVMLPELIDNEMALKRFLREGNAAAQLHHSNIVEIYEAGQAEGHYYIAMELIEGGTLSEFIKEKGELLNTEQIIIILYQIGAALDHAHAQGIVHRDLKLSNILLTNDERALLSDFGIAKHLYSEQTMVTAAGRAVGTPSFMSPEQITGDYDIDYRSDLYSLAVVAYVLFTGRTPFAADTAHQLMYKVAYELPIPPDIINPELSADISFVLLKGLSKEPGERYTSAHKFVTSLTTCQSYACEIISPSQTAAQRKPRQLWTLQWPLAKNIPTEAFIGAMITVLVLAIVLTPTFSVTPQFLLAKFREIDMMQSAKLAFRFEQPLHDSDIMNISLDKLTEWATYTDWATYDDWIQHQYNTLVAVFELKNAPIAGSGTAALPRELAQEPKPTLPPIAPKLLP